MLELLDYWDDNDKRKHMYCLRYCYSFLLTVCIVLGQLPIPVDRLTSFKSHAPRVITEQVPGSIRIIKSRSI